MFWPRFWFIFDRTCYLGLILVFSLVANHQGRLLAGSLILCAGWVIWMLCFERRPSRE